MTFDFLIPIRPTPKARPRVTRAGSQTYNPSKQAEHAIGMFVKTSSQYDRSIFPTTAPMSVAVCFTFKKPKSKHHKQPPGDIDNHLKLIFDALNGVLWHDDRQIFHVSADKKYGDSDSTKIKVEFL